MPDRVHVDSYTEPVFGISLGPRWVYVHTIATCAGANCVVHNPSDHHMRDWPLCWRGDRMMMERTCSHGIGHPDPDDLSTDTTHGCDGCCHPPIPSRNEHSDATT